MLNQIDESLNSERINIVKSIKTPLFEAISILKERYLASNYVEKQSKMQRILILSLITDFSEANWSVKDSKDQMEQITNAKFKVEYL